MNRRKMLGSLGVGLLAILSGCLTENSLPGGNDSPTDHPPAEFETFQTGPLSHLPEGVRHDTADTPQMGYADALVFTESSDVLTTLPEETMLKEYRFEDLIANQRGTVKEFIGETNDNNELLIALFSRWPKTNPNGIEVLELQRNDDTITGTAAVDGHDPEGGDDTPMTPAALIRVTVGSERPDTVALTITDGFELEHEVDVKVE